MGVLEKLCLESCSVFCGGDGDEHEHWKSKLSLDHGGRLTISDAGNIVVVLVGRVGSISCGLVAHHFLRPRFRFHFRAVLSHPRGWHFFAWCELIGICIFHDSDRVIALSVSWECSFWGLRGWAFCSEFCLEDKWKLNVTQFVPCVLNSCGISYGFSNFAAAVVFLKCPFA